MDLKELHKDYMGVKGNRNFKACSKPTLRTAWVPLHKGPG